MNGLDGEAIVDIVLGFTSGLVIFLYGINLLSEELRAVAGERMRRVLERFTVNRYAGVAPRGGARRRPWTARRRR